MNHYGYMLGGGFNSHGYYSGSGGWTGGSYHQQTIVNKTIANISKLQTSS